MGQGGTYLILVKTRIKVAAQIYIMKAIWTGYLLFTVKTFEALNDGCAESRLFIVTCNVLAALTNVLLLDQ